MSFNQSSISFHGSLKLFLNTRENGCKEWLILGIVAHNGNSGGFKFVLLGSLVSLEYKALFKLTLIILFKSELIFVVFSFVLELLTLFNVND